MYRQHYTDVDVLRP